MMTVMMILWVFTARRYARAVYAVDCVCSCPSVRHKQTESNGAAMEASV